MSIGEQGVTEDAILEFANAVDKEPSEPGFIFKLEQAIHERVKMEPSKVIQKLLRRGTPQTHLLCPLNLT